MSPAGHARRTCCGLVTVALAICSLSVRAADTFTAELWEQNQDLYQQILHHPFLQGMVSGSLDRQTFARYLVQDAYYLTEFSSALNTIAAHAPRKEWTALFEQHAHEALTEETRLHRRVLDEYGVPPMELMKVEPSPDTFAYTSYVVATANRGSFGEAVAAILPCYWIYREVGRDLKKQGTPDSTYREWIDAYSAVEYSRSVDAVLAIVDEVASHADEAERIRMRDRFRRGFQYEWMFWEAAYHPRAWPGEKDR